MLNVEFKCTKDENPILPFERLKSLSSPSHSHLFFFFNQLAPISFIRKLCRQGKKTMDGTPDQSLQTLSTNGFAPHGRRVDEGFGEAHVFADISLLPDKIRVSSGRRAVTMATGFVDRSYKHGEVWKQVLVVVTSGWWVMCFDHNLTKLWEANLQEDFPPNAHHREISISISNYTLRHGDAGLVIVGGRMEVQPHVWDLDTLQCIQTLTEHASVVMSVLVIMFIGSNSKGLGCYRGRELGSVLYPQRRACANLASILVSLLFCFGIDLDDWAFSFC